MSPARAWHRWAARRRRGLGPAALAAVLCLTAAAGCGPRIEHEYGKRQGIHPGSVNGTAVLAEMFENAGHTVSSWWSLSPRLNKRADCIVWFPDDFERPTPEVTRWLDDWLKEKPNRTLIYVGRDFDAEPDYWQKILPLVPADQRSEVRQRLLDAQTRVAGRRNGTSSAAGQAGRSTGDQTAPHGAAGPLSAGHSAVLVAGRLPGGRRALVPPGPQETAAAGPAALRRVCRRPRRRQDRDPARTGLVPAGGVASLLNSGRDRLVSFRRFGTSRLILVVNGSFLLNLPLLNHEHRKLAGQLIGEIGPAGKRVVFLESDQGGPPILRQGPRPAPGHRHRNPGGAAHQLDFAASHCRGRAGLFPLVADLRRAAARPGGRRGRFRPAHHGPGRAHAALRDRTFAAGRLQQWRQKEQSADGKTST